MPESTIDFKAILVPTHWCGTSKHGPWTCGGCSRPHVCIEAGRCARARDEDFKRGELGA